MEKAVESVISLIERIKAKAPSMPESEIPLKSIEESPKIKHTGVPKIFLKATKETIPSDLWKKTEPFFNEKSGLYIHGSVGTGKSYFCAAIIQDYLKNNGSFGIRFITVPEMLLKIKATFSKDYDGPPEESIISGFSGSEDRLKSYDTAKILFLDDLGIEKPTEWAQQTLYTIIDRRYCEARQTVFTSNLSLDDLSERLGDRIPSRIAEMCKVIQLKGKDRRLVK